MFFRKHNTIPEGFDFPELAPVPSAPRRPLTRDDTLRAAIQAYADDKTALQSAIRAAMLATYQPVEAMNVLDFVADDIFRGTGK